MEVNHSNLSHSFLLYNSTTRFFSILITNPSKNKAVPNSRGERDTGAGRVLTSSLFTTRLHQNLSTTLLLSANTAEKHLRVKAILTKQLHRF